MKVEKLGRFEQEELLRWFLHHMPQDRRAELMRKYPQTYNTLCDDEAEKGEPMLTVVHRACPPQQGVTYVQNGQETDRLPALPVAKPACER